MKRKLDACLANGPFPDFIQGFRDRCGILIGEVRFSVAGPPAQVDLQVFAAEMRDVAAAGDVAGDGLGNLRRIQILPAAPYRSQR